MKFGFESLQRKEEFASVAEKDWSDWRWQFKNGLRSHKDFEQSFNLSEHEQKALLNANEIFNLRVTPYYASLASRSVVEDPIRKILMPESRELGEGYQQMLDPLAEKKNQAAPRIIHRYSDRVLFLVTDLCSVYCRYCTRKHFTGNDQALAKSDEYNSALKYISSKKGIREVILSGGDPLTLSNSILDRVLIDLRKIDHVEIVRIGSRMPVVCPMRIDQELVEIFRRHKPVYLMAHFNHPKEVTLEAAEALERVVDHGTPVMNQMVLLNGINNHPAIVQALSRRLLYLRVKPYYMFQCDPSTGTDHLRTSVKNSMAIQRDLWGHLSGLAMPQLSLDIPEGGGKTSLVPDFLVGQSEDSGTGVETREFLGWDGVRAQYRSPPEGDMLTPIDAEEYFSEWDELKSAKL